MRAIAELIAVSKLSINDMIDRLSSICSSPCPSGPDPVPIHHNLYYCFCFHLSVHQEMTCEELQKLVRVHAVLSTELYAFYRNTGAVQNVRIQRTNMLDTNYQTSLFMIFDYLANLLYNESDFCDKRQRRQHSIFFFWKTLVPILRLRPYSNSSTSSGHLAYARNNNK